MNGDDHLCGTELKLWSLQQEIIFRWGVYTIFRWEKMHVPLGLNEYIFWFVPRDVSQCYEICQFVEHELAGEKRNTTIEDDGTVFPGAEVFVQVMEFSGIQPYMEIDKVKEMADNMLKQMMAHLKEKK